jgi:hypothetical protein
MTAISARILETASDGMARLVLPDAIRFEFLEGSLPVVTVRHERVVEVPAHLQALAEELAEIGAALHTTNALRGRRITEIARKLGAL